MAFSDQAQKPQVIWLCRHGNRIDFVDPTWKGMDPHLSEDGVIQARETGLRLRGEGIRHIFASPFLRTVETAHHIAEALDLRVRVEHGATEWLNPAWFPEMPAYLSLDDLRRRFPRVEGGYASAVTPRYPETADEASDRAGETARILSEAFPSDLLIVGHGHSVAGMAARLSQGDGIVSVGLCALFKLVRGPGRFALELNGDASHLSDGKAHDRRFH